MSTNLELINLEELLNDDCKCESDHIDNYGNTFPCSNVPVARKSVTCDHFSFNICATSMAFNWSDIQRNAICDGCFKPVADCWTIRPI